MDIPPIDLEGQIERAACRDHAQVLVEDQEGLADRIHDGLGESAPVIDVDERLTTGSARASPGSGRHALMPTDRDVIELVAVLGRSIAGSAPGEITMVSTEGVQPPVDYIECPEGIAGSAGKDAM